MLALGSSKLLAWNQNDVIFYPHGPTSKYHVEDGGGERFLIGSFLKCEANIG